MNFNNLILKVKKSNFFGCFKEESHTVSLTNTVLGDIKLYNIKLPERLRHFISIHNLLTLEELLNTEPCTIIECRNVWRRTVIDSRKEILDYLYSIRENIEMIETSNGILSDQLYDIKEQTVKEYFPLLKGVYEISRFNYTFIHNSLSWISLPERFKSFALSVFNVNNIGDLLQIDCDMLRQQKNIGNKTIENVQRQIIRLMNLKRMGLPLKTV